MPTYDRSMRVIGRLRISRQSEESTSIDRQRELIQNWADTHDHEIVGWAEDIDVSGSIDPFEAPGLGPWLKRDRLGEWDILVAWKLDRIARRAIAINRVFHLCQEHDKTLVCISDNIDLSTWVGRLIANVIAGVAEGELEAIRERTLASHRKLRELGRWPGGRPAYGYKAVERTDGPGWKLVHDEYSATIMREIVDRTLQGEAGNAIAQDLQERGVLTPAEYRREMNGEKLRGGEWMGQVIRKMLKSRTLLGHVTHQQVTVINEKEGTPILKGEPLVSLEEWEELQAMLGGSSRPKNHNRTTAASPMLDVALCAECEKPLHLRTQRTQRKEKLHVHRYYYCPDKHGSAIRGEDVENAVENQFLEDFGDLPAMERVFREGENHEIEIKQAIQSIEALTPLLGAATSGTVLKSLTDQISALSNRVTYLESLPKAESGYILRPTGKTYREEWEERDEQGRRALLRRSGITATFMLTGKGRGGRNPAPGALQFNLRVPADAQERLAS
ncbi:serine integrase [Rhodococcus phage AngryOrchard]|uniref:Serine integrase n=1 Tax=Rhodococcus phage AngryOrchard TaxID=1955425 RepID=A0A1S5VY36_9CAUD|nr:serine integrase [Rhodococcus phage AngryOrchard]